MLDREAYSIGYKFGEAARSGIRPRLRALEVPLPGEIVQHTSQATAFRIGYRDGLRGKTPTAVK